MPIVVIKVRAMVQGGAHFEGGVSPCGVAEETGTCDGAKMQHTCRCGKFLQGVMTKL